MAQKRPYRRHKKVKRPEHNTAEPKPKEPEYMVQVNDTQMLRKDILESLREVIIFMQGYEKFRKIQEDKVNMITLLKSDVKEITSIIDNKLRKLLPKGKLVAIDPEKAVVQRESYKVSEDYHSEPEEEESPAPLMPTRPQVAAPPKPSQTASELDALEAQLKDIENQLRSMG